MMTPKSGNENKYFFCYDTELAKYIKSKGFDYVTRAKHYKTSRDFTLYEFSEELDSTIKEWRRINHK